MTSTSYPESPEDWRGCFIANLATALAQRQDLSLALWAPPGQLPAQIASATTPADKLWLTQLSRQGGIAHLLRTRPILATRTILALLTRLGSAYRRQTADVVHVNWLQNALPLWGTTTPALVTVLGTDFGLLRMPGMKILLRAVLRQRRVILAPNADWMCPALENAFGDLAEIRPIPFGVDTAWFEVVRLPLLDDTRHWLAVTRLTRNKIGDLFNWGEGLFGEERQLHLFGPMQEKIDVPSWVRYHGSTHPAELMLTWFPEACGLITLSKHDEGRPQVVLEAMAAGLPVLASDLPAHQDIVTHQETGWLASSREDVSRGLSWLEDPESNLRTGKKARDWVKNRVGSWQNCADRYTAAYQHLLSAKG